MRDLAAGRTTGRRRALRAGGALLAALAVLPGLPGCERLRHASDAGATAPRDVPPGVEHREVSLLDGAVTAELMIPGDAEDPVPAVVQPILEDEALLDEGIAVVRFRTRWEIAGGAEPDAAPADPDARAGLWLLAGRPEVVGRAYFAYVAAAATRAVPAVLDWLEAEPGVDPERIAIAGSSTHGFVVLEALSREPRLFAGAARAACGDYHGFLAKSALALADDPRWVREGEPALDPDYSAELRAREPFRHAARFPPRPLLLLAGSEDPAIPVECALRTAEVLGEAYDAADAGDRVRFVFFGDFGHDLGALAPQELLEFWKRWLLEAADAAGEDAPTEEAVPPEPARP